MTKALISAMGSHHERSSFQCGVESLDRYIKERASQDQRRDVARVFVATVGDSSSVVGYYSVSSASVGIDALPSDSRRGLPRYPQVPCVLIGRLAVDRSQQGAGLGAQLLRDALNRILAWHTEIGAWAVLVDAIDEDAVAFYARFGFARFRDDPLRLFLPLETLRRSIA